MSVIVNTPIAQPTPTVWQYYTSPGAMTRLIPGWLPLRVVQEADNLRNGQAVLGLPGGVTWTSQHLPEDYVEGHCFTDTAVEGPGRYTDWHHRHCVSKDITDPDAKAVLSDVITTSAPSQPLRRMLKWRHAHLAKELAAQQRAKAVNPALLTIAISGASGLVGTQLVALLRTDGHRVITLVRDPAQVTGDDTRLWDPEAPAADLLAGVDAVIHLAGASILGRFSASHKRAIAASRIQPTRNLAANAVANGVDTFISASAIGYYGADRPGEELTEDASAGTDFLAEVCQDWEAACAPAREAGLRVVSVRTGIVQAAAGGVLGVLRRLFRAGLGGKLGDGTMMQSWIALDDLIDIYRLAVFDDRLVGPINAVAPKAVTNAEWTKAVAKVQKRPAIFPVPSLAVKAVLGKQGAQEVALADQHVIPAALAEVGFTFRYPEIVSALKHELGR